MIVNNQVLNHYMVDCTEFVGDSVSQFLTIAREASVQEYFSITVAYVMDFNYEQIPATFVESIGVEIGTQTPAVHFYVTQFNSETAMAFRITPLGVMQMTMPNLGYTDLPQSGLHTLLPYNTKNATLTPPNALTVIDPAYLEYGHWVLQVDCTPNYTVNLNGNALSPVENEYDTLVDMTRYYFNDGYEWGLEDGWGEGFDDGFESGYNTGIIENLNPLNFAVEAVGGIMNTPLLGNGITIGTITISVLGVVVMGFLLRFFRGG